MTSNPNFIARNADGTPLQSARVSAGNTTRVAPTVASPFIGETEYVIDFVGITLTLATAQSGHHTGSLIFEFSPDGDQPSPHWDVSVTVRYDSNEPFVPYPLRKVLPWFRVRYLPDDDELTEFRLTTLLHRLAPETLTRLFSQDIQLSEPVKVMRAGLMAENAAGTAMENLQKSTAGLLVDLAGDALIPGKYDHLDLGYTGDDLTSVIYKLGGITIATLTLGYTSGKLTSVSRA